MLNWIKRHKFWTGIAVLFAVGFAVERLLKVEIVYTAIYWSAGAAIATWLLFNAKKVFGRLHTHPPRRDDRAKEV